MAVKLSNNATSTLAVNINETATNLTIQSADAGLFPTLLTGDWFPLTLYDATRREIVHVTKRAGGVLTVQRAQEGTNAHPWNVGSRADLRLTKAVIEEIQQEMIDEFNTLQVKINTVETKGDNTYLPKVGGTINGTLTIDDKLQVNSDVEITGMITADSLTMPQATITTLGATNITTDNTIKVGAAEFATDGNIKGTKWQEWEDERAFEAISKRIEARGAAIADQKINAKCVTGVRLAGFYNHGVYNGQNMLPPAGWVSVGLSRSDRWIYNIYARQIQIRIPDIGWRAIETVTD